MRKNTPVIITMLLSFLVSLMFFFGTAIPASAAHDGYDHFPSVHKYMSMHMVDPNKTGPAFLHEDKHDVAAITSSDKAASAYTAPDMTLENVLFGTGAGILFLSLIAFIWKQGKHAHSSINKTRYNFSR